VAASPELSDFDGRLPAHDPALEDSGSEGDNGLAWDSMYNDPLFEEALEEELQEAKELTMEHAADTWHERVARQVELETLALRNTIEEYREVFDSVIKMGKGSSLAPAQRLLVRWFKPLSEAIDEEHRKIWDRESSPDRSAYGPYLLLMPPEKLAVIAMHEVINTVLRQGGAARFLQVALAVGTQVQNEVNMMRLKKSDRGLWTRLRASASKGRLYALRRRMREVLSEVDWPTAIQVKVGSVLINALLETATLEALANDNPAMSELGIDDDGTLIRLQPDDMQ
ncbi:RPOT3, partial [Symbiodinium sp. KB8]